MKTRINHWLEQARSAFWVLPAIAVMVALVSAFVLVFVDHRQSERIVELVPFLSNVSPDGTADLLGTVASSVLTLTGVTFSGTLVALTLASSQFGPRLLRNFIRSRTTQLTLGVLLATYVYCLVVLRSVRVGDDPFVPHLAALGGFVLSLLSIILFLAFIHHVIRSIQADRVVAEVHTELCRAIDRYFGAEGRADDREEQEREEEKVDWESLEREGALKSDRAGYVQAVDIPGLVALAEKHDLHCRVLVTPGLFVVPGEDLLAWDHAATFSEDEEAGFRGCFLIGAQRTAEQDMEYCVRQLVEVALRALSPGINDPFTAINCIDYLGGALVKVAGKKLPKDEFRDSRKVPRVRVRPTTFTSFLEVSCNQIRQAAADRPDVTIHLLEMLRDVGEQCALEKQLEAVLHQGELVATVARERTAAEDDARLIAERWETLKALAP